jgi:hypothetical protein
MDRHALIRFDQRDHARARLIVDDAERMRALRAGVLTKFVATGGDPMSPTTLGL